jgi:hypothetical protein
MTKSEIDFENDIGTFINEAFVDGTDSTSALFYAIWLKIDASENSARNMVNNNSIFE